MLRGITPVLQNSLPMKTQQWRKHISTLYFDANIRQKTETASHFVEKNQKKLQKRRETAKKCSFPL